MVSKLAVYCFGLAAFCNVTIFGGENVGEKKGFVFNKQEPEAINIVVAERSNKGLLPGHKDFTTENISNFRDYYTNLKKLPDRVFAASEAITLDLSMKKFKIENVVLEAPEIKILADRVDASACFIENSKLITIQSTSKDAYIESIVFKLAPTAVLPFMIYSNFNLKMRELTNYLLVTGAESVTVTFNELISRN